LHMGHEAQSQGPVHEHAHLPDANPPPLPDTPSCLHRAILPRAQRRDRGRERERPGRPLRRRERRRRCACGGPLSFKLGIHFKNTYVFDSRCPFCHIGNRKHMLGSFWSYFQKNVLTCQLKEGTKAVRLV
jgi:hypothetical protein